MKTNHGMTQYIYSTLTTHPINPEIDAQELKTYPFFITLMQYFHCDKSTKSNRTVFMKYACYKNRDVYNYLVD